MKELPLSEILTKYEEKAQLSANSTYKQVTVRLHGKGVVERGEVAGLEVINKPYFMVREGQFILSRIDARNGAFGLVPASLDGAIVTRDFPSFEVNQSLLLPEYMLWLSKTPAFVELCQQASEGTTNRVRLQENRFLQQTITLPPLSEQRRIVGRIEELAGKVEEARRLRVAAAGEASSIIDTALIEIFQQRANNNYLPLRDISQFQRGRFSHRPRNEPRFFDGPYPFIQIGDIPRTSKLIKSHSQSLNQDGLAISRMFVKGTIVISIAATIGAVGILDFDCCMPDSLVGIVADEKRTTSDYLYYFLQYSQKHLESVAPQSAQKNINIRILDELRVPTPSLPEQKQIAQYLDGLHEKVSQLSKLQASTEKELDALLPSILDKAFKGEL